MRLKSWGKRESGSKMSLTFALALIQLTLLFPSHVTISYANVAQNPSAPNPPLRNNSLCDQLIIPSGYPCEEHNVQTKDGFILGLQRVSSSSSNNSRLQRGQPVLLQHGLLLGGDCWFLNSKEQSLGFILADQGFDVWVASARGTRWSHGHVSLPESSKAFWDWSWEQMALIDLPAMIDYIYQETRSKVFIVGHSQGTIMTYAALTQQPDIVKKMGAAALISPISYLRNITLPLAHKLVNIYFDKILEGMGFNQFNMFSVASSKVFEYVCGDDHVNCGDFITAVSGNNSFFNSSRMEVYVKYEFHTTSVKNLNHLFQMIRTGTFAKFDYGMSKNLMIYRSFKPPEFDLSRIPESFPLWLGYGGIDSLADVTDVHSTLKELPCKPEVLYLSNYGHSDFIMSTRGREDVYGPIINFFNSLGNSSIS